MGNSSSDHEIPKPAPHAAPANPLRNNSNAQVSYRLPADEVKVGYRTTRSSYVGPQKSNVPSPEYNPNVGKKTDPQKNIFEKTAAHDSSNIKIDVLSNDVTKSEQPFEINSNLIDNRSNLFGDNRATEDTQECALGTNSINSIDLQANMHTENSKIENSAFGNFTDDKIYSQADNSTILESQNESQKPHLKALDEIQLIPSVLSTHDTTPWDVMDMTSTVLYVPINPETPRYARIVSRFLDTTRNQDFKIEKVEQVQNPCTFGQFLLKKDEMKSRYGGVEVELLFHGSTEQNITNICENNLNWRSCINSKFGKGISFSPLATYASHSCDKTHYKHMLFCLVLISKECIGKTAMILPEVYDADNFLRCDTAIKNDENRSVVVKFSDHEFYPLYKFCFTGTPKSKKPRINRIGCTDLDTNRFGNTLGNTFTD